MLLKEHNKSTYTNIVDQFKTENRVAVVQPTGTGKSYLILQLICDNADKHFAVCSPSVYIFSQLESIAEQNRISLDNVTFLTYSRLSQMTETEVSSQKYDYIVFDEFHRCGAAEWGRGVEELLAANGQAKILGTSATPIRYLDSGRNMAEELFGGVYAVNMSLAEAIRKKILPLPVYVTSWYSFRGDIEQLEMRAQQTGNPRLKHVLMGKIQKAKSMIAELDVGIERVFEKHITDKNGKYIVFCPNVEQLKNMLDECREWFKNVNTDIHKYAVFSASAESDKQFMEFRSDKDKNALKLLFCVDMLNEGVHFDDIDGVIMLRATKSANVFYQQLGRALACSDRKTHPVIFDIVNNFETGDTAQQYASIMEIARDSCGEYDDDIEFELYDYVRDIREILNELNDTFANSWDFNFELLKEYAEKYSDFPDSNTSYEGVLIGKWAHNQRVLFNQGKLSDVRIEKLNSIGFPWNVNEANWQSAYNDLKLISKRLHHFPKTAEIPDDKAYLRSWIRQQKTKYSNGALEPERADLLIALGCDMDINSFVSWEDRYEQLDQFVKDHGRFPANADSKKGKDLKGLCTWVNTQRKNYQKGTLSKEQTEKLDKIHFPWSARDTEWNKRFEILRRYYDTDHCLPGRGEVIDGVRILTWYNSQARAYQKGEMPEERIKRFESAKIPLDLRKNDIRKSETWNKNLSGYIDFIKTHGRKPRFNDRDNGYMLYKWSYTQIENIRKNLLTSEQVSKLASIGITAEGR